METLFLAVLNMSLTASYIIPFVVLARQLLKKVPKIYSYCLWSVVLFRLLCPFSLESAISLLPEEAEPITRSTLIAQNPEISTGIPIIDQSINPILPPAPPPETGNSVNPLQIWTFVAQILWISGIIVMLLVASVSLLRLKKKLMVRSEVEKGVFFADDITSPFVFGVISPKIYLPSSINEEEIPLILAHERFHLKRFDHVTRLLSFVALTLHWFNPLVWISYYLSEKDMETSCDEGVLREKSLGERGDYATALLKFTGRRTSLTPLAFSENDTKGRVKNIMKMKKTKLWVRGLACMLVVGLIVGFSTRQKQREIIGVLPEELENLMLTYYTKRDGVEETFVYRLWDNEVAQKELSQLLGNQAYYLIDTEDEEAKMAEMMRADQDGIVLWGEYDNDGGGFAAFDLGLGATTVEVGNTLTNSYSGFVELVNQETLMKELFEFFEENKEMLHQVEVTPEKPLGEDVALVGTLNGLTYEIGEKFYLSHPMLQPVGGSHLSFVADETYGYLRVRVSENSSSMPKENVPKKHYLIEEYRDLSSELVVNQHGNKYVYVYLDETGFFTEPCYLPFVSVNGDEYLYQITAVEEINTDVNQTLLYIDATFYFQEYKIEFGYMVPFPLEDVMEWTQTLFEIANSFEIDQDGLHTRDIIWSDYQYVSK